MSLIVQKTVPYDPLTPRALPGVQPMEMADWLIRDDAFAGQMAERARLLATQRGDVLALDDSARAAAGELLDLVLALAYPGGGDVVVRADGVAVAIDRDDPLGTVGHLVQEDFCILQKRGGAHVLTGAVLCFPASWMLAEKFMRPLIGIHDPVEVYDAGIAARVQRLFDGVRAGRPMWRFNALWYASAALHQPRSSHDRRADRDAATAAYLRSERQGIVRLPVSDAVVFSIHSFVVGRDDVMAQWRR